MGRVHLRRISQLEHRGSTVARAWGSADGVRSDVGLLAENGRRGLHTDWRLVFSNGDLAEEISPRHSLVWSLDAGGRPDPSRSWSALVLAAVSVLWRYRGVFREWDRDRLPGAPRETRNVIR